MIRGKTRHQLFLPDELSRRLKAMAKSQNRARSDLLLEMVETCLNRRGGSQTEDRIVAKLDRILRIIGQTHDETMIVSHSFDRFVRIYLSFTASFPNPDKEANALGAKRYDWFLEQVAKAMAKGAVSDGRAAGSGDPSD